MMDPQHVVSLLEDVRQCINEQKVIITSDNRAEICEMLQQSKLLWHNHYKNQEILRDEGCEVSNYANY